MQKIITLIVVMAACAAIGYFLWDPASPHEKEEEESHPDEYVKLTAEQLKAHDIETSTAASGTLQRIVRAPAKISIASGRIAHVYPKAAGIALTAHKNLGDSVDANENILTLESREMAEAKAAYLTALKKEQLKKSVYDRELSLYEKKISSEQEYQNARTEWEESRIDTELANQKLCSLGLCSEEIEGLPDAPSQLLRIYEVRSPLKGQVIAQHVTTGELVPNDHMLYIIADLSKVWAEIHVFAQDRHQIQKGQNVLLSTHDRQKTEAAVVYLSPIIDEDTRTSTVIAEVENSSGLWLPGMFAQAELITEAIPVNIMVPKEAIQNIDGNDCLFVEEEKGFAVRPVATGRFDEKSYEIVSGLSRGETYASKNTFLLKADLKKEEAEHMD